MLAPAHRSGLWLVLGAFALLGLFAMHGLGGHGAGHGTGHGAVHGAPHAAAHGADRGAPPLTATSASHEHAGEGAPHHHAGEGAPATDLTSIVAHHLQALGAEACHGDCADGSTLLMVLCLAVLSAVAGAALLLGHLLRPAVQRVPGPARSLNALLREARGPGPPGRFALSVQRC